MPDAVPGVDEITAKLLGSVENSDMGSSPEDSSPSPEVGGNGETGSPEMKSLMDKIASLEGQVQGYEKRVTDNQAAFHNRNEQLQIAQEMLKGQEVQRNREAQMARAAEAMKMPDIEDADSLLDDPENLKGYIQNVARWSAGQGAMYAHQLNQQLQSALPRFSAIVEAQKHSVVENTASKLDQFGFGEDFRERLPSIEQRLSQYGDPTDLMLQENMLITAYQLDRNERNLPMFSEKKADSFPTVGKNTRLSRSQVKGRSEMSPMIRNIQRNLNLPDWVPSDDDLKQRGL